jgi:hypothetical protein
VIRIRFFDALGDTDAFPEVETTEPVPVFANERRLVLAAEVLEGPFKGETVQHVLLGRFDFINGAWRVERQWTEIDGRRHIQVDYGDPIDLLDPPQPLEERLQITGNRFNNVIVAGPADDVLFGGRGADRIIGLQGDDRLAGGGDDDLLLGGRGDDVLTGGGGADRLKGEAGVDRLIGGKGRDLLFGGAGADIFEFRSASDAGRGREHDRIHDFGEGRDGIDLSAIDARSDRDGDQAFRYVGDAAFSGRAGELRVTGRLVLGDVDGDGRSDYQIELRNDASPTAGDFLL